MGNYDKNSWKEKIDPAFDKPVKMYIKYLSEIENHPDDGSLTFQDDFIELIKKTPDFKASYNPEFKKETLRFVKNIGLVDAHESTLFLGILYSLKHYNTCLKLRSQKSIFIRTISMIVFLFPAIFIIFRISSQMRSLIKTAEKLKEEESRKFYINKIQGFLNDIWKKPFFKFQKDFVSITFSLFIRIYFIKLDEYDKTEPTKEQIEHLKDPKVINQFVGSLYSTLSQIAHQRDMSDLLNKINKGDDSSIFKAVVIDKGLISHELIVKRINQAKISGDTIFLKKLGTAMAKSPLERVGQHGATYAVLKLFWKMVLYKLTNEELYEFLKYCGLCPPPYPDGFDKFMQRYIKQNKS